MLTSFEIDSSWRLGDWASRMPSISIPPRSGGPARMISWIFSDQMIRHSDKIRGRGGHIIPLVYVSY